MLSPAAIARYVTSKRTDQLLEAVIANGQYLPVMLKVWLSEVGPSSALSLGLKRVVELSRRSTPAGEMLTQTLLAAQASDGGFENDPLATALAAAALYQLMHDHHIQAPAVQAAHQRAIAFLKLAQSAEGLFYDVVGLDSVGLDSVGLDLVSLESERGQLFSAYILQLLARDPQARQSLSLEEMLQRMERQSSCTGKGQHCGFARDITASSQRDVQSFLRIARASMPRTAAAVAA